MPWQVWAISDLHVDYRPNMAWLEDLPTRVSQSESDPLSVILVAGDLATGSCSPNPVHHIHKHAICSFTGRTSILINRIFRSIFCSIFCSIFRVASLNRCFRPRAAATCLRRRGRAGGAGARPRVSQAQVRRGRAARRRAPAARPLCARRGADDHARGGGGRWCLCAAIPSCG